MSYDPRDLERIARIISLQFEDELINAGLFYRIFYRCKSRKSLSQKLLITLPDGAPKYNHTIKLLRDLIGVRINLYFYDDLEILTHYIKNKYSEYFCEETIDHNTTTEFKPTRINIIYRIPSDLVPEFREVVNDTRIDSTFELQLRTVFSEGWHEIEHDFRYKCPDDWSSYPEISRTLNGILAALETHEWSIIQLCDKLSYEHYKSGDISAMIRVKLRIRFDEYIISEDLLNIIQSNSALIKELFKIERNVVINTLLLNKLYFPKNVDNILYLINYLFLKDRAITEITPKILLDDIQKISAIL